MANKLREWWSIYAMYRRAAHSPIYAARIAWGICFRSLPF